MIERDGIAVRLLHACVEVITSEDELTQVDVAGGPVMVEVVSAISSAVAACNGDILDLFDDASRSVSRLELSSGAAQFWDAWLEGLAEAARGMDVRWYADVEGLLRDLPALVDRREMVILVKASHAMRFERITAELREQ